MRKAWILVAAVLCATHARTGEPRDPPFDAERAAWVVLGDSEEAWRKLGSQLEQRKPAELVALLGAVRKHAAYGAALRHSRVLGIPDQPTVQDAAAIEAETLALAGRLQAQDPWRAVVRSWLLRLHPKQAATLLQGRTVGREGAVVRVPAKLARGLTLRAPGSMAVQPEPVPPLCLLSGQRGRVGVGARFRYLQDYEVEIPNDGLGSPILAELGEGASVLVGASRGESEDEVRVFVHARWADVVRPIELYETELLDKPVRIQLPELRTRQVRKQIACGREAWIVAVAGPVSATDAVRIALLHIQVR